MPSDAKDTLDENKYVQQLEVEFRGSASDTLTNRNSAG
tara:strand:- start:468 stop:581 length:114 start_codon:yes stop_codon:yes gene_type:complete